MDGIVFYKVCDNVDATVTSWRKSAKKLFKWFKYNQMKGNIGKCYLILSTGDLNQIRIRKSSVQGSLRENSLVLNLIIT